MVRCIFIRACASISIEFSFQAILIIKGAHPTSSSHIQRNLINSFFVTACLQDLNRENQGIKQCIFTVRQTICSYFNHFIYFFRWVSWCWKTTFPLLILIFNFQLNSINSLWISAYIYIIAEEKNQEFRIGGKIRNQVIFLDAKHVKLKDVIKSLKIAGIKC